MSIIIANNKEVIIPNTTTPVLSVFEIFIFPKPSPTAILRIHNKVIKMGSVVIAMICFRDLSKWGIVNANPNKSQ